MNQGKIVRTSARTIVIILSSIGMLMSFAILKPPADKKTPEKITTRDVLLDVSLFETITLGYSFMVTSTSFNSGVGTEIINNGSFSSALREFFSPWQYESHYQVGNVDPNKTQKTLFLHPLLGYEYNNYLISRGYSNKKAILTSMISIYVFEKGFQGSFETPSMYDFFSYASGISLSILARDVSGRLYRNDHLILKGAGVILNPFLLIS